MIRLFDILFSFLGLFITFPFFLIFALIGFFDTGSPFFFQERVGLHKKPFKLVKFRTMSKGTPSVASHLASRDSITTFGRILRSTKLDELPQLFNVLKGEMSLVGPRPNLFNQLDLIELRDALGVYDFKPGITGLSQIKEIDMSTPALLAKTDREMIEKFNLRHYFLYIFATVLGKGSGDRV